MATASSSTRMARKSVGGSSPPHSDKMLIWADYVPQETLFWRRRIWDKAGGKIDEAFQFALDWDMLLRFREAGAKFVRLPRFLGAFRVHACQKTSADIADTGDAGDVATASPRSRLPDQPA